MAHLILMKESNGGGAQNVAGACFSYIPHENKSGTFGRAVKGGDAGFGATSSPSAIRDATASLRKYRSFPMASRTGETTLCCPLRSALGTGGKREKAVFG